MGSAVAPDVGAGVGCAVGPDVGWAVARDDGTAVCPAVADGDSTGGYVQLVADEALEQALSISAAATNMAAL